MEQAGYFERKISEAILEEELRDMPWANHMQPLATKVVEQKEPELWGQTEHKLNAALLVTDYMTTGSN